MLIEIIKKWFRKPTNEIRIIFFFSLNNAFDLLRFTVFLKKCVVNNTSFDKKKSCASLWKLIAQLKDN